MAHIPVHPAKRGVPWWLWLVLALALAALVAFLFLADDDDDVARTDGDTTQVVVDDPVDPVAAGPTIVAADSLPDVAGIEASRYAGRRVDLANARVTRVVGDNAFYVQTASGREMLVALEEPAGVTAAGSAAGFRVTRNAQAQVRGTLRQAPEGFQGIPRAARTGMRDGALYIAASAAEVTAAADPATDPQSVPPPAVLPMPGSDSVSTATPTPPDSTSTR